MAFKFLTDGWQNLFTNVGTAKDKRTGAVVYGNELADTEALEMYRGDDVAARIVNTIPDEMTREGWEVTTEEGTYDEAIEQETERLNLYEKLNLALKQCRAFGGSALLLNVNDGAQSLEEPVNLKRLRSVDAVTVLTPRECQVSEWYSNPLDPKYGEPLFYRISPITASGSIQSLLKVHESRIVRFTEKRLSRRAMYENYGYGDSVLNVCQEVIRDFNGTWSAAAVLTQDFAQAIFKVQGLADAIAGNQFNYLKNRMDAIDLGRSVLRALVLDSEEDFERKSTPLTGLPEVMDRFERRMASAAKLPVFILFGKGSGGLQSSAEQELRAFYDQVAAEQRTVLKPRLKQLYKMIMLAQTGPTRGQLPADWSIEFEALWQMDETQEAQLRKTQADVDSIYLNAGVLGPEEVRQSRFSSSDYSTGTVLLPAGAPSQAEETTPRVVGEEVVQAPNGTKPQ